MQFQQWGGGVAKASLSQRQQVSNAKIRQMLERITSCLRPGFYFVRSGNS
jgi:hypothetical protein